MNTIKAKELAIELMNKHKLNYYSFEFMNSKDLFGQCNNRKYKIRLSEPLTLLNTEDKVRDTILHEIAHALTPGCNHNEVWKRVAKAIGADGERCYDTGLVETPMAKWTAVCRRCGKETQRHRKNKRLYCGKCYRKKGKILSSTKLKWIKNKEGL